MNDAVGFTFGFQSAADYHVAFLMDDQWPQAAADGVAGPMMKFKRRNARPCLASMNASSSAARQSEPLRGLFEAAVK